MSDSKRKEPYGAEGLYIGIDPSQHKSAMVCIVRPYGAAPVVTYYEIDSIARATYFVKVVAGIIEESNPERIHIALEWPRGSFGCYRHGTAIVRSAAGIFIGEFKRIRLGPKIAKVAPIDWHKELGVSAMKTAIDEPKERAKEFAKRFVLGNLENLSPDVYDAACLAEYAKKILAIAPKPAPKRRPKK